MDEVTLFLNKFLYTLKKKTPNEVQDEERCFSKVLLREFDEGKIWVPMRNQILDLKISRSGALSLYNREWYGEIGNELTE